MYFIRAYRTDCYQKTVAEVVVKDQSRMEREVQRVLVPGVKVVVRAADSRWMGSFNGHKHKTRNGNLIQRLVFSQEYGKERRFKCDSVASR